MATKRRPISQEEAEELVGGGGLLDRIGRNEPVISDDYSRSQATKPTQHQEDKGEELMKLSLYLSPQEVNDLDRLVMKRRLETGRSPRRNQLVREAIQAYLEKEL